MNLKALILVGGQSTRFGEDKYLLKYHGKPQYEYFFELLTGMKMETFISCNAAQRASIPLAFPTIQDRYAAIGPIGGIASAVSEEEGVSWLVIACDMIHVKEENVLELLSKQELSFDVVTFKKANSNFSETTFTIYNPTSHQTLFNQIEEKNYRLQRVLEKLKVKKIIPSDEGFLKNVNLKSDLD